MFIDDAAGVEEDSIGLLTFDEAAGQNDTGTKAEDCQGRSLSRWHILTRRFLTLLPCYDQSRYSSLSGCWEQLKCILVFLLPSFTTSCLASADTTVPILRPTAYLDALRGLAAWTVFNRHLTMLLSPEVEKGFGFEGKNYQIYKLPIIRLIHDGDASVTLFFVISGYVLSISPILAMRKQSSDPATFMRKVASSTLRRPFRLYLPVWAAMFWVFVVVRLNCYEYLIAREDYYFANFKGPMSTTKGVPRLSGSLLFQLDQLIWDCSRLLGIFNTWNGLVWKQMYDPPAWTIPLEFRSSLVLFLTHAILFYMTRRLRLIVCSSLVIIGVYTQGYDVPLFYAGYIVAELSPLLDLLSPSSSTPNCGPFAPSPPKQKKYTTFLYTVTLLVGLYISSIPNRGGDKTPGFVLLTRSSPWGLASRFWTIIGFPIVVFSLDRLSYAQYFLSTRIMQYLGKISFAMYLMHVWMIQSVGLVLFSWSYRLTGMDSKFRLFAGFMMAYVLLMGLIVWASDVFHRAVELPSLGFGFKLEQRLLHR